MILNLNLALRSKIFLALLHMPFVMAYGQSTPSLTDLKTPSSPGFVLLGVEPTSIEKPTTPSAFATSLQSAVTATGLRPGYSLETAPYWLVNHKLQLNEYLNPSVWQNVKQTFSVSLATSNLNKGAGANTGTGTGLGFRFQLFSGKTDPLKEDANDIERCKVIRTRQLVLERIEAVINNRVAGAYSLTDAEITTNASTLRSFVVGKIRADVANSMVAIRGNIQQNACASVADQDIDDAVNGYLDVYLQSLQSQYSHPILKRADLIKWHTYLKTTTVSDSEIGKILTNEYSLEKNRSGLLWDFAGAGLLAYPQSSWNNARFQKFGLWTTLGGDFGKFDVLGSGRVIFATSADSASNVDFGIKGNYGGDKFKIGVEGLFRQYWLSFDVPYINGYVETRRAHKESWRYAINISYKFSDVISVTSTIGKNFDDFNSKSSNLLTILGLQYNIASYTVKSTP